METDEQRIRVLVLPRRNGDETVWVAQGLDVDVVASGPTVEEAKSAFGRTLLAQALVDILAGEEPLASHDAAPMAYWKMFDRAKAPTPTQIDEQPAAVDESMAPTIPPAFMLHALIAKDVRVLGA